MTDELYIESIHPHQAGHPSKHPFKDGSVSPIISVCSGFTDIPYTATSDPSLAYTPCDPLLLTPISSAGSPSMPQSSKLLPPHYSSSTAAAVGQQPTPPASSKMYWSAPFDMSAPGSQSGSPMPAGHPSASMATDGHFEMAYLPREDIPEPPRSPYFGPFSVSEPLNPEQEEHVQAYYGITCVEDHPLLVRPQPHPAVSSPQPQYQQIESHGPIIPDPAASPLESDYTENPGLAQYLTSRYGSPRGLRDNQNRVTKPRTKAARRKRIRTTAERAKTGVTTHDIQAAPSEPIQFKPCVPDEERFLLELRVQYSDTRGKTMWDDIGAAFAKKFGRKLEKAALQMKLTRAKKYIQWPDKDQNLLRELYLEDEKELYQRLATKFQDRRGGNTISFNAGNIECQLVEMGVQGLYMHPETKIRPRKRPSERRRSSAKAETELQDPTAPMPYHDNSAGFSLSETQRELLYAQVESRTSMNGDDSNLAIKEEGPAEEMAADLQYYHQQQLQQQEQQQQQQQHQHQHHQQHQQQAQYQA